MRSFRASFALPVAALALGLAANHAATAATEWPEWCGHADRNMISDSVGLPVVCGLPKGAESLTHCPQDVVWARHLGQAAYGSPVVAGGRIYVGGCASGEGTPATLGMLWCLNQADGRLLWQFRSPFISKLYNRSWGITSTPTVEGNRVYLLGQLGEVLCLDVNGLVDGNDGPFTNEASLLATGRTVIKDKLDGDGNRLVEYTDGTPQSLQPTDADIVWRFDMIRSARCWPFNALNAGIVVQGNHLYVATCSVMSRGGGDTADEDILDWETSTGHTNYPSPSIIVLDKATGTLVAQDGTGAFDRSFHGAHASPCLGVVDGRPLIFWGSGDGTCYALDPTVVPGTNGSPGVLRTVWSFDCVAPESYDAATLAKRPKRPVEIMATPVFWHNRVYVAVGNDLLNSGPSAPQGRLLCLDARPDIQGSRKLWSFEDIRSSSCTVAIEAGRLYTGDAAGNVYCLDADTGHLNWHYSTKPVWGSPLVADGRVYVPTHGRGLQVLAAAPRLDVLFNGSGGVYLDNSPAVAGQTIYLASAQNLFALRKPAPWPLIAGGAAALVVLLAIVAVRRRARVRA